MADKLKDYETLEKLRDYEKAIVHICELEKEMAEFLGLEENVVREVCKSAYERVIGEIIHE